MCVFAFVCVCVRVCAFVCVCVFACVRMCIANSGLSSLFRTHTHIHSPSNYPHMLSLFLSRSLACARSLALVHILSCARTRAHALVLFLSQLIHKHTPSFSLALSRAHAFLCAFSCYCALSLSCTRANSAPTPPSSSHKS